MGKLYKEDLLFQGLKHVMSSLNDREYVEIEAEDPEWNDLDLDLKSAVNTFDGERIVYNYEGDLTIDHLQILNEHYYIITLVHLSTVIIVKDNSRELEKLIYKYRDEFIDTIRQYLGINDKSFLLTDDHYHCTMLYFPDKTARKYVDDAKLKKDTIKFHNSDFDIEYKLKEVDGKKYAFVRIYCSDYSSLYELFAEENYKAI